MSLRKISRALISVSDKTGLIDFARGLADQDVMLISTGGTARALRDAGLKVSDVSEITSFPEMMDGRVKTLHPMVHGGLLALRDNTDHAEAMKVHGIAGIDLLVCNLYPFEATVARGADFETTIENIDIGGPAMTRSAAKNHDWVTVVVDVEDYSAVLDEIRANGGATTLALRRTLAQRAFARTAAYDAAVSNWFAGQLEAEGADAPPRRRAFGGLLRQPLRYGENPHQKAAFYVDGDPRPGVAGARQIQGKELSYNNINDTDAAYELVAEFDPAGGPACAIIKHANPCGVALAGSLKEAYQAALACDPTSAFGGIIAFNQTLDGETAEEIGKIFTEVIIAPDADADARQVLAAKKNLRLLLAGGLPDPLASSLTYRSVSGGFLVQTRDNGRVTRDMLKLVTRRVPSEREIADMLMAFTIGKHVKSNAVVYVKDGSTAAIGMGQTNRVDSARIAALRAKEAARLAGWPEPRTVGSVAASEAFFPFPDGLLAVAEAGATAVIQPGGSLNDQKVIDAADEAGLAMVFTGMRHFRH
ncbi:MAG: bifunctional phosphoribosylaminoimidazolecarboxamide formyltransferase/IMP cyclohydrolase [Alphaproteobacteria bacterium 64-11]|nr:MAG: bifunctional phosphoribosylaminoimidazolecarboxamide formyltransferase/IMP cyclohydrolase [Alphaproteobacteria bacterium 64-11]